MMLCAEAFLNHVRSNSSLPVFLLLVFMPAPPVVQALDLLSPFSRMVSNNDDVIIWQAPGYYVKLVEQDWARDHTRPPRNEHPVDLPAHDLAVVLASIRSEFPDAGGKDSIIPVFTPGSIKRLTLPLLDALSRAGPKTDVVFAVTEQREDLPGNQTRATAARLFLLQGKLHLIFGDVLTVAGEEATDAQANHYARPRRAGKRIKALSRSVQIVSREGMEHPVIGGRERGDWVIIDASAVIAAYGGPPIELPLQARHGPERINRSGFLRKEENPPGSAGQARAKADAAPEASNGNGSVGGAQAASNTLSPGLPAAECIPANTSGDSIEQRLVRLRYLYQQGLISEDEYGAKRQEILKEL